MIDIIIFHDPLDYHPAQNLGVATPGIDAPGEGGREGRERMG